jgi:hypothetical protein
VELREEEERAEVDRAAEERVREREEEEVVRL